MTKAEAKIILAKTTPPETPEEIALYKEAVKVISAITFEIPA